MSRRRRVILLSHASYKYVQLDPDYDESDFRTTVILADTLESILTRRRRKARRGKRIEAIRIARKVKLRILAGFDRIDTVSSFASNNLPNGIGHRYFRISLRGIYPAHCTFEFPKHGRVKYVYNSLRAWKIYSISRHKTSTV